MYYALIGIIYGIVGAFALAYMTLLYNGLKAKAGMPNQTAAYTSV